MKHFHKPNLHQDHATSNLFGVDALMAADHPFYCETGNYHSAESSLEYTTIGEFLDHFEQLDFDLNLCFRWDITLKDEDAPDAGYQAFVFLMLQRKGIFLPVSIKTVDMEELPRFARYLKKHWENLQAIWTPFSLSQGL